MTKKTWEKTRNILAFPYDWQRPAKTEEWAYERCLSGLEENNFAQMVFFPWATLIDLQNHGNLKRAMTFQDALRSPPPRITLIRATVCQHIYAKDVLPWFKQLKITDFFWPHATQNETLIDGIRIHPFPLYPVSCCDGDCQPANWIPLSQRRYLYSFIGAYQPGLYLSESRRHLFELPQRNDTCIVSRNEWHFEKAVYGEQIAGLIQDEVLLQEQRQREQHYKKILRNSVFSLCPSGSGPNSIRLWESLGFGCIPVILSDTLRLPGGLSAWQNAAVFVTETASSIAKLHQVLEEIVQKEGLLEKMQAHGKKLWRLYGDTGDIGGVISQVIRKRLNDLLR